MSAVSTERQAAEAFGLPPQCSVKRLGQGNIHATFLAQAAGAPAIVLQRLSAHMHAEVLIQNARVITDHWAKMEKDERRRLAMVPLAKAPGSYLWQAKDGSHWRAFRHIPGSVSFELAENAVRAREAAGAFGRFLKIMKDLPLKKVSDEFLGFHDGVKRFAVFKEAVAEDKLERAKTCRAEIDFIEEQAHHFVEWSDLAKGGAAPRRVVHNDTKISNVLFDDQSGESLCVVDLDTVSSGYLIFDFGDLVRSTVTGKREDEADLSSLSLRMDIFRALADGFLSEVGAMLTVGERGRLVFGAKFIALELGMRFLTDYLSGDAYFNTERPGQNLDRARTQLKIAQLIGKNRKELEAVVAGCL